MNLALPLILVLFGTTFYVRSDGGTAAQCTGKVNAPYPGIGLAQPCAFKSLHDAIKAYTYGDRVELAAGQNFDTSFPFTFGDKGTPPTNTEADYITITTTDPSGIPAVLSGYPNNLTRPTTAMAARMPKLRSTSSEPVINIARGAKWLRFEGLEFTAVDTGVQTIRLIQSDFDGLVASVADMPNRISFRRNWFHPPQETGVPMSAANIARTVENAMYLDMNNSELLNNAFTGFAGKFKYGGEAGNPMTSSNWLITLGENNVARNNFFGAWTYAVFSGGSGIPRWAVTGFGTVSNCQGNPATQCDFSNTTGLEVGEPLSIFVSTSTSQNKWGASWGVESINGSTVKFKPLCQSFDGSNSCTAQNGTPANGDRVQWDGLQPRNFLFERNAFVHDKEWAQLLGECGGKGYDEIKSGLNFTFNGNLYEGCSGHTVTVRNQNGDFTWASISGLKRTNNFYRNSNNIFVAFCQDAVPTRRSSGLVWHNNLATGAELNQHFRAGVLSGNWTSCDSPTITNNTVAWNSAGNNFSNFGVINNPTIRDNILHMGQNACFRGETTVPMANCWVNGDIRNNAFINIGTREYEQEWLLGSWPNQTLLHSWDGIFVRNTFDATGDYHLAANSPLLGKGTNGSNPGADVDVVMSTVFGNQPLPSPSPLPTSSPTPVATPTIAPSPSPSPVSSPSPVPTPTIPPPSPTPTPSGTVGIQGYVYADGERLGGATVTVADKQMLSRTEDAYFWFESGVPLGAQIVVTKTGYVFPLVTVQAGTMEQLYFVSGRSTGPSPTPTPVSSPSPVPSPTVEPSPSPSPSPSVTPAPSPQPSPPPQPCEMAVAPLTMPPNSARLLHVSLTAPLPGSFTLTATPDTGQLTVMPRSQSFSNVTALSAQFRITSKKRSANVTVVGPCGSTTLLVNVQ